MSTRLERLLLAKTAAYTLKPAYGDRSGLTFTNRAAIGSVTFTLPAPATQLKGWWYEFLTHAAQSVIVAGATAGDLCTVGNSAADNVGFQVTGKKVGGRILVFCDGTQWHAHGIRQGGGFCVNGTEVTNGFGSGSAVFKSGGILDAQASAAGIGNGADATDDTLFTKSLLANALVANGDGIRVRMCGVTAANGQNKRVKVFFGGTAVVDSGVITSNAKNWWAEVVIRRTGAGAQIAFGSFGVDGVADVVTKTTPAEDETGAVTVKGTGSSPTTGAANDVKGHDWQVEALPV